MTTTADAKIPAPHPNMLGAEDPVANLDRDQPVGVMAPPTQADVVHAALDERLDPALLAERLVHQAWTKLSH